MQLIAVYLEQTFENMNFLVCLEYDSLGKFSLKSIVFRVFHEPQNSSMNTVCVYSVMSYVNQSRNGCVCNMITPFIVASLIIILMEYQVYTSCNIEQLRYRKLGNMLCFGNIFSRHMCCLRATR